MVVAVLRNLIVVIIRQLAAISHTRDSDAQHSLHYYDGALKRRQQKLFATSNEFYPPYFSLVPVY
jgi:hypothetical protein